MNGNRNVAPHETHRQAFDTLARTMHERLPRRRALGVIAALAAGLLGLADRPQSVQGRKRRRNRRVKSGTDAAATRRGIPPNCIYVCCDGTCDSWKMCMKCVKWPKPTTAGVLAE